MTHQKPKPYKASATGIQVFPKHLQIPGNKAAKLPNVIVREQPMAKYRVFVERWMEAVTLTTEAGSATFAQMWIFNDDFRALMTEALEAVGVLTPSLILPSQLEELLMVARVEDDPDLRPLLFRLHADRPDPKIIGEILKSPRMKRSSKTSEPPTLRFWNTFAAKLSRIQDCLKEPA